MKFASLLKPLIMIGMTSMTLAASAAPVQYYYSGPPRPPAPLYQQPYNAYAAQMRARLAQFDQHLDNQLQRILGGMENGQLTMREAIALLHEHLEISQMERRYMADGRLGPNELVDLERRLDLASKHILFETHDRQDRDWRGGDRR